MSTTKDHKIILKCIGSGAKKVIKEIVGLGKGAPMITVSNQACLQKCPVADFVKKAIDRKD